MSVFVHRFIKEVLDEFGISELQVVGCTTDNASNMVCGIQQLHDEAELQTIIDIEIDEVDGAVEALTGESVHMVHVRCAAHTLQLAVRDALETQQPLLEKVRYQRSVDPTTIFSTVQVIQLFKLLQIRQLARELRTPSSKALLHNFTQLIPIIDVQTRWGSTYDMVERIIKMRTCIEHLNTGEL